MAKWRPSGAQAQAQMIRSCAFSTLPRAYVSIRQHTSAYVSIRDDCEPRAYNDTVVQLFNFTTQLEPLGAVEHAHATISRYLR